MRIFVTALVLAVVLTSSAFAGNVALSPGATATCEGTPTPCQVTGRGAPLTIDGISYTTTPSDKWVAPNGTVNPAVLIDLGGLYTVDFVTITGVGTPGNEIQFELFTGTNGALSSTNTGVGTQDGATFTETAPSTAFNGVVGAWSVTIPVSTASSVRYILYDVTGSYGGSNTTGWDDAYADDIVADAVPEPGTIGLMGAGLLALGFTLRKKK